MKKITLSELRGLCPEEERVTLGKEVSATIYRNGHELRGYLGYNKEDGVIVQVPSMGIELVKPGSDIGIDGVRYKVVKEED